MGGGGRPVFIATNQATGAELWITDGTTAGTLSLGDLAPGLTSSNVTSLTPLSNGLTVFSANNGTNGAELWVTDGTAAGTGMLLDMYSGLTGSGPSRFTLLDDGRALFVANSNLIGQEVWITDRTIAGTHAVKDVNLAGGSSVSSQPLTPLENGFVTLHGHFGNKPRH